jgi:hypothetical protein
MQPMGVGSLSFYGMCSLCWQFKVLLTSIFYAPGGLPSLPCFAHLPALPRPALLHSKVFHVQPELALDVSSRPLALSP